jgi:voltage-gated sodium channel
MAISQTLARLVATSSFQGTVLLLILLNAVLIGAETSRALMDSHGPLLHLANLFFQAAFVVEILLRILACWPRPMRFWRDPWNAFDFAVVAVSLIPAVGPFTTIARLARVLRVTRLVSAMPDLRLIISTMLRSIPSMGHVILMLSLLLYVYAVMGYYLFHAADPQHWGTLGAAFLALFQVLTLEGWAELQQAVIGAHPLAWAYFASFIVVGVFVVVNLFIAVVINNLERARNEEQELQDQQSTHADLLTRIERCRAELAALERALRRAPPVGAGPSLPGTVSPEATAHG